MNINECIQKIDNHLKKKNVQPLIADVQNHADLEGLITHYKVGSNNFLDAASYCRDDEYPRIETLLNDLANTSGNVFVVGLSIFLKLEGEQELKAQLRSILDMSTAGHAVIITYQCRQYLNFPDRRLALRLCVVDGDRDEIPEIIFASSGLPLPKNAQIIRGINKISGAIEKGNFSTIYIETRKQKASFPHSILPIKNLNTPYEALCLKDNTTCMLHEEMGTYGQWNYALKQFEKKNTWVDVVDFMFGNHMALDLVLPSLGTFEEERAWLYFIALSIFGAPNSWCLNEVSKRSSSFKEFYRQAYRCILDVPHDDENFWEKYSSRKTLIKQIGSPVSEAVEFCKVVRGKDKYAVYYLTDNTQVERELIFSLLNEYGSGYERNELLSILKFVYPALSDYMKPYRFKNDLLDSYFQEYKYQKVINKIFPEFEDIVKEQAYKRDYNLILEPRSSKIESIDCTDAELYFMDALGVEFLGYIIAVCERMDLLANISVCSCELPSITSRNKDFVELFQTRGIPIKDIKDIDDIKHHGKDDFDYQKTKLPLHLGRELEIISETIEKIKTRLVGGTIKKAILIADHGASRLAVIHETENIWEMSSKGEHSGRCCPKSDVDAQPEYAVDAGDFWALANYDRFRGGRKANVEVHGGATLEEVTVPIIELTYMSEAIEVWLMPPEAETVDYNKIPEIAVSFRKKAAIKIFASEKLNDVNIFVNEKYYNALPLNDNFYLAEMPDLKKGNYAVDVYAGNNPVARGLKLIVKAEGSHINKMF